MKQAAPPTREKIRRWNAGSPTLATNVIIAVNVAVFLYGMLSKGGSFTSNFSQALPIHRRFGLDAPDVAAGEWYRIVTSGFLHFGVLHLGMNMWVLYQMGQLLERSLDRVNFVALYFAAMLGGAAGALILEPFGLTAGASGAVFGLFGATAIGLHRRGVNVLRTGIGTALILNLVLTFAIPGISKGGHLGGLVAGGLVGAVLLRPNKPRGFDWVGLGAAVAVGTVAVVVALSRASTA
ncbi:MAG: rhomboid family intramembrane serine protease [Acidimicrobiia bacterium]